MQKENNETQAPDYGYLERLNEQQRAAVEYCAGPQLVIAGAGSGKTRVLTYKVVHLLRLGFEPQRILALTFTNKAAREMTGRIASLVGPRVASRLWAGTFHSIFLRILRYNADRIGFKSGFTIYDAADSKSLVKMIIKDLCLDEKIYKPGSISATISNAKNAMMTPQQYEHNYGDRDRKAKRPMTARIFALYNERLHAANAMDFDDILFFMNLLLRDCPDLAQKYREQFRYILVDEYQDTNFAQHMIVSQLAQPDNLICVVGDDAQSIYSFRGANIGNIINLEKSYNGLKTFRLERNYRSTQNIVNAAGSLIQKNSRQLHKDVYSENEEGDSVEIVQAYSDIEEAFIVATRINASHLTSHDSLDDYAILYRTNAQSRVLEEALRKRSMPYRIVGGMAFYQRKEVKDMIAYFRLAVNPDDDEALRRIINYPARGIGDTTLKKLQSAAIAGGVSIWTVICNPVQYPAGLNSGTQKKLKLFHDMIEVFVNDAKTSNAFELGQLIFNRTGVLLALAHDNTPESISRQENLSELLTGLKDFTDSHLEAGDDDVSMQAFLAEVSLATDADEKDKVDEPRVTMMTVHAAKGLEFKHVYIVGAEEELFPSALAMDTLADIEEERRLMYVAITRAEKTCMITYARQRFRNGKTVMTQPSRFLRDIDRKFTKQTSGLDELPEEKNPYDRPVRPQSGYGFGKPSYSQRPASASSASSFGGFSMPKRPAAPAGSRRITPGMTGGGGGGTHSVDELSEGMRIEHAKLGKGTVTAISSVSGEPSVTVVFDVMGEKKLLLKFAKFEILDK